MIRNIPLNIIKNKINDFALKSCAYIPAKECITSEVDSAYYIVDESPFYILCSNKRLSTYFEASGNYIFTRRSEYSNSLLDAIKKINSLSDVYNIDLNQFLILQKNSHFLGWLPVSNLIDNSIKNIRGNKYCKHFKDKFYYGDNTYSIDNDKLYLFIRIMPEECIDLTNLLIYCQSGYVYNISERGDKNKVGSLGFIVKLNNRESYPISKTFNKVTNIKYPFLTKDRINSLLFDNYNANYIIKKEIIYIEDNTKLDKYGIKILDNF